LDLGAASSLTFDMVGTYLDKFDTTRIAGGTVDHCAGFFGARACGTPLPKWRSKLRVTYALANGLSVSGAWRYFNGVTNDDLANVPKEVAKIPSVSYFDLTMSARIGEHYTFRIGAQNLLDKTPPFLDGNYSNNGSNTYAQVYDSLGRYIYAAVQLNF
jgi:iron complex outermembrane receptor protein